MNKKILIKKIVSMLIGIIFLTSNIVSAATITIGQDTKVNFVNAQFYVLGNQKVPTRTSISGADNGYIFANDLCKVKNTNHSKYWQVEYPVSNGKKTAYVDKAYILNNINYSKDIKINANDTVYTKSDMKTKFGTVFTTDKITLLSPVKDGKAQIMYNVSGGYKIGWIKVNNNVSVTSVKLNKTSLSLQKGKIETLTATVAPSNATNKAVTWTSSNTKVATVDSNGKVTAVGVGTANITVKTKDGSKTAVCKVTVPNIKVTSVKLNKTSLSLQKGKTETLTATVAPSNATNKAVTWTSSNTKVATVDSNGKVTAVAEGKAKITVKTKDGSKTSVCEVTVQNIKVTSVKLNKTSLSLQKGKIETLTATVAPSNATNKAVTWTSSNTKVATVDSNGKVTAVGVGTANITVKTKDGSKTAVCKVTVTNTSSKTTWTYPVKNIKAERDVTQAFGKYNNNATAYHLGVDISSRAGLDILAASNGTVTSANSAGGNGKCIVIRHKVNGKDIYSVYSHLKSMSVKVGDTVKAGEKIGVMGNTGNSTGVHLHFAIFDKKSTSPLGYGNKPPVNGIAEDKYGRKFYDPLKVIETNGKSLNL